METPAWYHDLGLVTRPEDGERLGYLQRLGDEMWQPLNLLGVPLGEPQGREEARRLVREQGLSSLSQRWWARAPIPLPDGHLDAHSVDETADWRMMVIAELTPERALLRGYHPVPEKSGNYVSVTLPEGDVLRSDYPNNE